MMHLFLVLVANCLRCGIQAVGSDGLQSSLISVNRGVPQGSIVGSLQYKIVVNDSGVTFNGAKHMTPLSVTRVLCTKIFD